MLGRASARLLLLVCSAGESAAVSVRFYPEQETEPVILVTRSAADRGIRDRPGRPRDRPGRPRPRPHRPRPRLGRPRGRPRPPPPPPSRPRPRLGRPPSRSLRPRRRPGRPLGSILSTPPSTGSISTGERQAHPRVHEAAPDGRFGEAATTVRVSP